MSPASRFQAVVFDIPPLRNPPMIPASDAGLADDEIVLGVHWQGQARAYQRAALSDLNAHVIHDDVGPQAIVVTHCVRNGCTRVFLSHPGQSPDVRLGGWRVDQTMELIVGLERFSHRSRDIPLAELPFAEMPWAEWKRKFLESPIYRLPQHGPGPVPAAKG